MKKCICGIFLLTVLFLTSCGGPEHSFEKHVKSGNYSKAIQEYNKNIAGNIESENRAEEFMRGFIEDSWEKYVNGTIPDQEFSNTFELVERINNEIPIVFNLDDIERQFSNVQNSKDSFIKGIEYMNGGDLEAAISAFSNVIPDDSENYSDAKEKLDEAIYKYQDTVMTSAKESAKKGEFDTAINKITQAEYIVGNSEKLEECKAELYTDKFENDINEAYSSGDNVAVIRTWMGAAGNDYIEISPQIKQVISSSSESYKSEVFDEARKAFGEEKDYEAAIKILQVAIAEIIDDEKDPGDLANEFLKAIEEYKEYIPVYLTSLEYTQKANYLDVAKAHDDDAKDVNGVQYDAKTVICPGGASLSTEYAREEDEGYVIYNLNFKYSRFTGTIYRPYKSLSSENPWEKPTHVKIYGDDVLLYEAPNITKDTYDSIEYEIDVTGVRNLKIVMLGVWTKGTGWPGIYSYNPKVCLAEGLLQK